VREPVVPYRETARARTLADRWHVGFTDVGGGQGMLGQVEGRTADDVAYWLASYSRPGATGSGTWRSTCARCSLRRSAATCRTRRSSSTTSMS
jgi:hypothetical protein